MLASPSSAAQGNTKGARCNNKTFQGTWDNNNAATIVDITIYKVRNMITLGTNIYYDTTIIYTVIIFMRKNVLSRRIRMMHEYIVHAVINEYSLLIDRFHYHNIIMAMNNYYVYTFLSTIYSA